MTTQSHDVLFHLIRDCFTLFEMTIFFRILIFSVGIVITANVNADTFETSGHVDFDLRLFLNDPAQSQQRQNEEFSIAFQPEIRWENRKQRQRMSFVGFLRGDPNDAERSHADIREAYWAIEKGPWDFTIGINKVFWGVAESRHLIDIINQTDLIENIDGEEKLGQPMINLNYQQDWGRLEMYLLPFFRERTYPGVEGRLRSSVPVNMENAQYESAKQEKRLSSAFRYSHYFGNVDFGVYLFEGVSREPRLEIAPNGKQLTPVYDNLKQVGVDVQHTGELWLWKLETIFRDTRVESSSALVGGFEYTNYQVFDSEYDLGLLTEVLYDNQSAPTLFNRDVFVGLRLTFNNPQDSSILAGVIVDEESRETFINLEAEHRINNVVSAELQYRKFHNTDSSSPLSSFAEDDYVQIKLRAYF